MPRINVDSDMATYLRRFIIPALAACNPTEDPQ